MAKVFLRSLVALTAAWLPSFALAAGHPYLWEGFEREINWGNSDGAATVDRQVVPGEATEGTRALKILFKTSAPSAWAGVVRKEDLDWSPYGTLLLDVYNPTGLDNVRVSIVIESGEEDVSHEYYLLVLGQGWNRDLRVNLLEPAFISAASNYQPRGYLVGRSAVGRVAIRVYPGEPATGFVLVDNIRLLRTGLIVLGDLAVNPVAEVTASGVHLGYVPSDLRLNRGDLVPVQSFDNSLPWTAADAAITVEPATDFTSYGDRALAVRFPAMPDGFDLDLNGMETKLAGSRLYRLDVYNPGTGVSVSLKLEDSDGGEYESRRTALKHGWNQLIWDFTNQNNWKGGVLTQAALGRLVRVALNIASARSGRIVLDGPAVGSVSISAAAKAAARFRVAYSPSPDFEVEATPRVENTYYGISIGNVRDAGPEGYLESAGVRADLGGFRTGLVYRQKVKAFDNPINQLVNPQSFGNEVSAVEFQGRYRNTEMQGLMASRLEYGRYNSRVPTGFGPDALAGLRLRRDLGHGIRLGGSFIEHSTRYGAETTGIPRHRRTVGSDLEGSMASGNASLSAALEGAMTAGDRYETGLVVPRNDRFYYGASVSPSWGRLGLSFGYSLMGYDFDADFTKKGGNTELASASGTLQLEGLPGVRVLDRMPFTGGTLAKNLSLGLSGWWYATRDRYRDPATGELRPTGTGAEADLSLGNDYQSTPNFGLGLTLKTDESQWDSNPGIEESLSLRLPFPGDVVANLTGRLSAFRTEDKSSGSWGEQRAQAIGATLERDFASNLVLSASYSWTKYRDSWEGVWGDVSRHGRWTLSARQPIGASMVIQADYGVPALYGEDYGSQDTMDVITVNVKSSF